MQYRFAKEITDQSDLSSGRVLYSLPGHPAFPVRLASEIFQRCLAHRERTYGRSGPCTLYDPCSGAAYHLTVLAYLHPEHIRKVIASDIDEKAVALAARNLSLLSLEGLEGRIDEIQAMLETYGKESHREALHSAHTWRKNVSGIREKYPLETRAFQASATDREEILKHLEPASVDLVFTDIPYGQRSRWQTVDGNAPANPLSSMLDALLEIASASSIVAIAADKQQKVLHEGYQRLEQISVRKRHVVILRPA